MYPLDDTIVAIASAPGGAARGIVRLSGPDVCSCLERLFRPNSEIQLSAITVPTAIAGTMQLAQNSPRLLGEGQNVGWDKLAPASAGPPSAEGNLPARAYQPLGGGPAAAETALSHPAASAALPCEVYLWPDRRSYTGQPVAEIHTLGSPPLLEAAVRALGAAGARPAGPGEFTLRAFLAGRIDLTQAEAVLGVIDAADPRELDVALGQLAGGLAKPLSRLRDVLLDLLSHLEAGFDFADEDLSFITAVELDRQLTDAATIVAQLLQQIVSRGQAGATPRVVLVGQPNSGKSSLFNALLGTRGAIVSPQPGTTRDYLAAELDLDGLKCQLIDTAGVQQQPAPPSDLETVPIFVQREWDCPFPDIDQAAQQLSLQQLRQADVQIVCIDASQGLTLGQQLHCCPNVGAAVQLPHQPRPLAAQVSIRVLTKTDLCSQADLPPDAIATSSVTGAGTESLREAIRHALLAARSSHADMVADTAIRCRQSLAAAAESLARAGELVRSNQGEELVAAEVRGALDELGKIVGAVYTEDLLERIFSRFCVGK